MYAVPVPHEIAAPSSNGELVGQRHHHVRPDLHERAWPPSYMPPYTFASVGHIW